MLSKLWAALGITYPSVDSALLKDAKCVRIGQDGYCIRSASGFAEALTHHMSRDYVTLASDTEARKKIVDRAQSLTYPCVVWFTGHDFNTMSVDDPNMAYPVQ
ncbi:hypothetical protein pEaSNUABM21_00284 [Erwinia phage pEa_SNUABM_21]|nr:hypothetical protein pEaSNUABM21_00284 [Erwinia phage pEa_SNUABM_21]